MNGKVLFVDDEPAMPEGYKRLLGRDVPVDTAVGGTLGLAAIAKMGPYAAISDMRTPQMDGAQFLAKVRGRSPTTVCTEATPKRGHFQLGNKTPATRATN